MKKYLFEFMPVVCFSLKYNGLVIAVLCYSILFILGVFCDLFSGLDCAL